MGATLTRKGLATRQRIVAGAAELFTIAGQPLDAQRCLDAADS